MSRNGRAPILKRSPQNIDATTSLTERNVGHAEHLGDARGVSETRIKSRCTVEEIGFGIGRPVWFISDVTD